MLQQVAVVRFTFGVPKKINMRNITLILAAAMLLGTSSCKKDDDTKTCDYGYEGTTCATETREKFIGTYNVEQTTDLANPYQLTMVKLSANVYSFSIENITNEGYGVRAEVSAVANQPKVFNIPEQVVNGNTISGTGNTVSGALDMLISVNGAYRTVRKKP